MDIYESYCHCGGQLVKHPVGEGTCLREVVPNTEEPKRSSPFGWIVRGELVTDDELKTLWTWWRSKAGLWTRPKQKLMWCH